jgi:hypothetical protein
VSAREYKIPISLALRLASVVVHADEWTTTGKHDFDFIALRKLIEDDEVTAWIKSLGPLAPVKR